MVSPAIEREIREQLDRLPMEQQRKVLDFARALVLATPRGTPGREVVRFAGTIGAEDAARMNEAIEEGCEAIDPNEW